MTFKQYPKTPNLKDTGISVRKNFSTRTFLHLDENNDPVFKVTPAPTVVATGTVKLHGTHADVVLVDGELSVQSRNRIIPEGEDHAGFNAFVQGRELWFKQALQNLEANGEEAVISGEWCGGNIQPGVAITGMEKAFVLFNKNIPANKDVRIFNIYDFPTFELELDFNNMEALHNQLLEITLAVEENCPVGAVLNPETENTIGEGVVWNFTINGRFYIFKHKGDKHQRTARVPKVKVEMPEEKKSAVEEFLAKTVTGDRLAQGIEYLNEMNITGGKRIGEYIKWVSQDVFTECKVELQDLLDTHELPWKGVISKQVANLAKAFVLKEDI